MRSGTLMRYASLALRRDMLKVGCNSSEISHVYDRVAKLLKVHEESTEAHVPTPCYRMAMHPDEPQEERNSCPWLPLSWWYGCAHVYGIGHTTELVRVLHCLLCTDQIGKGLLLWRLRGVRGLLVACLCSSKHLRSVPLISPIYCFLHLLHWIIYVRFVESDK